MVKADETHIQSAISVLDWFQQATHFDDDELLEYLNEFDIWPMLSDKDEMKSLAHATVNEVIERIGYKINLLNRTVMIKNAEVEQEELMKMYSSGDYKVGEETLKELQEQEQEEQRSRAVIKLLMEIDGLSIADAFKLWFNAPARKDKSLSADECFEKLNS